MSNPAVEITITTDADKAEKGFDGAARAADKLGTSVDQASSKVEKGTARMDGAADAADGVASKSSQATGALGALSAGFELVGADKYAAGLQQAAMATDFMSGVGDALNLVLNAQAVAFLKDKAATIANTIATKASAVAAKISAAAQWALNAALNANPIGLIVVAVLLLVAGFVLLYKKSDAFRGMVNRLWSLLREGVAIIGNVVKAIGKIVFPDGLEDPFVLVKKAIDAVIESVEKLIGWFKKIKIPKISLPKIPGFNSTSPSSAASVAGTAGVGLFASSVSAAPYVGGSSSGSTVIVNVTGAIDPESTARQIRRILDRHDRRIGFAS